VLHRETKGARTLLEESVRFNAEHGLAFHVAISDVLLGSALHTEAHDEAGLTKMRDGLERHSASGAYVQQSWFLTLLAAALGQRGDSATGLAALAEAESHVSHGGERWAEAEIHRRKGELLWSAGEADEAEQAIRQSIEVARRQQAKLLELRAATSLARLWAEQSKHAEAYDLLAPVYDWFTEGFDTPDLKEAKALLDGLA
jgi:predicted ATPase